MNSTVSIEGMEFYAHHGCFPEERIIGTWFTVDLYMDVDTEKAQVSDSLEDTVNYAEVYTKVKEEISIPEKLIEHVARRIVDRVLRDYPMVLSARIKLSKLNPPLGERIRQVSISFGKDRPERATVK